MEVRDSATVREDVEKTSSQVMDMLALKGKTTEAGAMVAPCGGYDADEHVYRARHPWSLYGVPFSEMEKAVDRLRTELPKNGWVIVKDGVDASKARSPQIVAESGGRAFSVDVRLQKAGDTGNAPAFIEVTVESACYRSE
ncbi:hypothetical protein ACFVU3_38415 [Streptomyces sp. NPDC058052]|uniref:hypothetical protein n=1 Tax=Streptomyces sp. NPDC058052 TaxID=3346316 RepID=UPI0036E84179